MSNPLEVVKHYTVGQLAAIVHKIGGEKIVEGLLNGTMKVEVIKLPIIAVYKEVAVDETRPIMELAEKNDLCFYDNFPFADFPLPARGQKVGRELVAFKFKKCMPSVDSVVHEMGKEGCEPATIWDMIAVWPQYAFIALGSVYKKGETDYVPHTSFCFDMHVSIGKVAELLANPHSIYLGRRKTEAES